jgi:hypothetical protein
MDDSTPGAFGECSMDPEGAYYRMDYLSTYPATMPNYFVSRTYPEDMCTTDNMNYISFYQTTLTDFGIPLNECLIFGPGSYLYSTSACGTTGQLTVNQYSDTTCTTLVRATPVWGNNCIADDDDYDDDDDDYDDDDDDDLVDDGDDDDDDDDDYDDDDYSVVGVVTDQFCT